MTIQHKSSFKKISMAIIALIVAYLISYLMLKGGGAPRSFFHTILMVFLITLGGSSKRVFWFILFPLIFVYALYAPIGITYGSFTYDFLVAGLATDSLEVSEFIHQIPYTNYLIFPVIIGGLLLYRKITTHYKIQYYRNRTFIAFAVLILAASQAPTHLIRQIKTHSENFYHEQQLLQTLVKKQTWGESSLSNSPFENYILIVGESARRDYHHAYGYPINNTPFMSSANGILIDGLTSGGSSTVPSLKAMLTLSDKNDWDADYSKTIVGLAKSAGIKTFWLSNQGYFGTFDTPISAIASTSDNSFFTKYGGYSSTNSSDFELLPQFEEIITQNPHEKKLIIIHLYGSHPDACDRVVDHPLITAIKDPYYNYINCYISSIHKTDTLLQKIVTFMDQESIKTKTNYSLLYFADHGLAHREINGQLYLNNNRLSKHHYDIPLFMTNSESHDRKSCKSFKSALNFTNGLASWMGIQNNLLDPNYSLFDCKDDPNDFGLAKKIKDIAPDPAISIEGK